MIFEIHKSMDGASITQCIQDAKDGKIDGVKSFFETHQRNAHINTVSHSLISGLIAAPQVFERPLDLLDAVTENNFSYRSFWNFCKGKAIEDRHIWMMPLASANTQTVQAAGILMAEYVAHAITYEENFSPAYLRMMEILKEDSAMDASTKAAMRDSILMVQHAMVKHVCENKDVLPLPRAAAMLPILEETVTPDIARLWSVKLRDVRVPELFSLTGDPVVKAKPVWEP